MLLVGTRAGQPGREINGRNGIVSAGQSRVPERGNRMHMREQAKKNQRGELDGRMCGFINISRK